MSAATDKPIYVPVALPLAEAEAVFAACRSVFADLTTLGVAASPPGVGLARGMYLIAQAIDKARGTEGGE